MKDNAKLIENNSNSSLDSGKILSKLANLKYYDIVIQIFKYFWVSLLAAIADFTLFMALYEWIGVWYIAANTAGFALGVYINYTLSTIFVFKGAHPPDCGRGAWHRLRPATARNPGKRDFR